MTVVVSKHLAGKLFPTSNLVLNLPRYVHFQSLKMPFSDLDLALYVSSGTRTPQCVVFIVQGHSSDENSEKKYCVIAYTWFPFRLVQQRNIRHSHRPFGHPHDGGSCFRQGAFHCCQAHHVHTRPSFAHPSSRQGRPRHSQEDFTQRFSR